MCVCQFFYFAPLFSGPGTYDPSLKSKAGNLLTSKGKRFTGTQENEVPGPGAYEVIEPGTTIIIS